MTPAELRERRSALGLSGAEFARLVGAASDRTVRRWEAGERDIPGGVCQLIRLLMWLPERLRDKAVAYLIG